MYEVKREQSKVLLTKQKERFIIKHRRCGDSVLPEVRKQYLDLVLKHHQVVSNSSRYPMPTDKRSRSTSVNG